jgi:hypothetical protein
MEGHYHRMRASAQAQLMGDRATGTDEPRHVAEAPLDESDAEAARRGDARERLDSGKTGCAG